MLQPADERGAAHAVIVGVDRQHSANRPGATTLRRSGRANRRRRPWRRRASASTSTSGVGSASMSSASAAAHRYGSGAASTDAHNHHSGPELGCRSTMRRQATTRPAGSNPRPRKRARGLAHEHALIAARRPGHIAEPLDRMHPSRRYCHIGALSCWARYRLQPWRATRPSIPS